MTERYRGKYRDCPFCGSKDISRSLLPGLSWVVGCNECGCRTPECLRSTDADSAWNRRACDPAEEQAEERVERVEFRPEIMSMPLPCEEPPF